MSIKSDKWIRRMALEARMIEPFAPSQVRSEVISYGVSSYGYDLRVADEFKIPAGSGGIADPKRSDSLEFSDFKGEACIIPPHSFILGRSLEYFCIPRDILTICFGKSSYARCGIIVNVTPFEPEWEGFVTMAIANIGPTPARIHANEGIAQVLFLQSDEPCEISYKDKKGKYQAQQKITLSKI